MSELLDLPEDETMAQKPPTEDVASRRGFLISSAALVAAAMLPVKATAEGAASMQVPPNQGVPQ